MLSSMRCLFLMDLNHFTDFISRIQVAQTKELLDNVRQLDGAAFREELTKIRRNWDTDPKLVVEEVLICQPLIALLCFELGFLFIRHANG
jgi:hypothetical protein